MTRVRVAIGEAIPSGPSFKAQRLFLEALFSSPAATGAVRELRTIAASTSEIRPAIRSWAEKWHLSKPWLLRILQVHAETWRDFPEHAGHFLGFAQAYRQPEWPTGPSWNPYETTEAAFRLEVGAYIRSIKKHPSFVAAPVKEKDSPDFERLVRYQVRGDTPTQIGGAYASKGVLKAVRETAALVGLTLRPAPKGRPRKTKKGT